MFPGKNRRAGMFSDEFRRSARNFDPWRELNRLQDELNRVFGGASNVTVSAFPTVNLWSNEEGCNVEADVPGMTPDSLEISVLDESLTLRGTRDLEEQGTVHRRERYEGEFERTVQLPFKVDPDKVTAKYKNGVLRVMLPRLQPDRARRVTVEVD
jgi:HSP20 family protein